MGKLIIDGNSVYSVDEECLKRRQIPETCGIREAVKRQEQKDKMAKRGRWQIKTGAGKIRLPFIWKWCSFSPLERGDSIITWLHASASASAAKSVVSAEQKQDDNPAAVISAAASAAAEDGRAFSTSTAGKKQDNPDNGIASTSVVRWRASTVCCS